MKDHDEGYIKFQCNWTKRNPYSNNIITNLNQWRKKLYTAKLLGAYPDGIGFGNISHRSNKNTFFISGSKTGNLKLLDNSHYSKVSSFDIEKNEVSCKGPIIASSESMSHAVIYQELTWVNAVFHVHDLSLWTKVLHHIPTTKSTAKYGTPEMAREIIRLIWESNVTETKVFAMAGHREGLISFGKDLDQAGAAILNLQKV